MSSFHPHATTPPSLADLTRRHLSRTNSGDDAVTDFETEPYEVVSGFRTDARVAWQEATAVLKLLGVGGTATPPSDWAGAVRQMTPASALPMCLGHFPQLVSDLSGLRSGRFSIPATTALIASSYVGKAERVGTPAALLAAAAVARLAGEFETADRLLQTAPNDAAQANEVAALLWQQGKSLEAVATWEAMPDSAVRSFNLGLASLVGGKRLEAARHLTDAVNRLPESGGWRPLASLYLALSEAID